MPEQLELDARLERRYIDQVLALDMLAYHAEPPATAFDWADRKPWLYTILRRANHVLGYGLVLPLERTAFEALRQGTLWEDELTVDRLSDSPEGFYLASLAAHPEANYRERAMLVGSTVGPLLRLSKPLVALPISAEGEKVARMVHMTPVWCSAVLEGIGGYRPTLFAKAPTGPNPFC